MEREITIFHIDVNSAYLSWEAVRQLACGKPDLRCIPSAIGGDRDSRTGIILAKSVAAKKMGVKTGEPVSMALRKCPNLTLVRPDFKLYIAQSRAFMELTASQADAVYGDSFTRCGTAITGIGNNVSLVFERMDFGACTEAFLEIEGATPLARNPITVRIRNEDGAETTEIADFTGKGGARQRFALKTPGGNCTVTFVFLPGSQFDFAGFRFDKE